ncbi:MAG: polyprenyl synthetase family protein [Syntrophobacteraceae bacterium]|nr:polyprenyl synthetase family protein [Syntrophobacteraceae bacterium]
MTSDPDAVKERIVRQIRSDLERIEVEIERQLTTSIPLISVVGRYIMGSGGKRLRPLLMVLAARLCGYKGKRDAALSVVFEFVHAATLLHDDVVDHAEVRRSKPAANTIWGNPAVVLIGDFLYSKAILMAVGHDKLRILEVLTDATTKMAEGEVLQLINSDNLEIDEGEYLEVVTRKTAVLISAACQIGGIFASGPPAHVQALRDYGYHLGIAFQLIDDTLDYTGDREELGKPVGNDIQEGKVTLPLIYALRHGDSSTTARLQEIFGAEEIPREDFIEARDLVVEAGGIDYTQRLAMEHISEAKEALTAFPPHPTRDLMVDIADYVVFRRA